MLVTELTTYPVKGCYRVPRERATVYPWGLDGDRRWLIVDAETGLAITQREEPALTGLHPAVTSAGLLLRADGWPDLRVAEPLHAPGQQVTVWSFTGTATRAGETADTWLSKVLDRMVRLVWLDDPAHRRPVKPPYAEPGDVVSFADGYPVLLANAGSLASLNDWLAEAQAPQWPLPMHRFRPNVVVTGAPPWAEDAWVGGRLRIGEVRFRVPEACGRCTVTTTDQETGERGPEPLRTLGRYRRIGQKLVFGVNLIPEGPGEIAVGDPVTVV